MKKFLTVLLIGLLVLSSGCSPAAAPSGTPSSELDSSSRQAAPGNENFSQRDASGFPGGNRQNAVMGRIIAVSESEITLEIGVMSQPRGTPSGENPQANRGDSQADRERPSDASAPQGGPPEGGGSGDPRVGGFSRGADLEYSGEQASYVITEPITVTKGMGGGSETLSLSDLSEGDVVQLVFDESMMLVSIHVLVSSQDGG